MNLTTPQKLLNAGRYAEAEQALPPAGTFNDPRAEIVRARIYAAQGQLDAARSVLQQAVEKHPSYAPLNIFLGTVFWDVGNLLEAETAFQAVLSSQPENDLARSYLALCRFAAGDYDTAAETWRRFGFSDNTLFRVRTAEFIEQSWLHNRSFMGELPQKHLTPPASKLNIRKVLAQFYRRDFQGMLEYLPEPSRNADLAVLGAIAHEMLGNYSMARKYLDQLKASRDEWPDPLIALHGRLLTRQGKLKQAAADFAKVLIVGPEDFGVNYYLGIICLAYGMKGEARQYFLRAFTGYMVDTYEFQWWQLEQVLLGKRSFTNNEVTHSA